MSLSPEEPPTPPEGGVLGLLRDSRQGPIAQLTVVALMTLVTLQLRVSLDLTGALDVDTLNFGLAALDFNPVEFRPHPPGYPGYVLYLKLLHFLVPGWDAPAIAKWGSRLAGSALVPAAWWATRSLIMGARAQDDGSIPALRPLVAAALVITQPILWYYGSDGQSHAGEALATLLLFVASVRCRRSGMFRSALLLVIAFGLAASLRPTLCLLGIPMLTWVFWGRPWRDWAIALPTGIVAVLLWYGPLIAASGGWDLLQRSQDALVVNYFLENFSILGRRSDQVFILVNLNIALWGAGLALLIWPAWRRVQQGDVRWARAAAAVIGFHLAFYLLIYTAETGYFAGIAAITLLAPATWFQQTWGLRTAVLSAALVAVLGAGFVLFGPASSPFVGIDSENFVRQPTLASVRQWDQLNRFYRDAVCPYAKDGGALVLTDSSHGALIRGASVSCGLAIAQWRGPGELNPDADTILLHDGPRIYSVPTGVPLEAGPPITFDLPGPRTRVLVSPAASDRLMKAIRKQESCPPIAGLPGLPGPEFPEGPVVWETRCLPVPLLGANRIRVQPAAESRP